MKLYSIVLLFKKESNRSYTDGVANGILWANSEEEAFGKAYETAINSYKEDWRLSTKLVVEIPDSLINTKPVPPVNEG